MPAVWGMHHCLNIIFHRGISCNVGSIRFITVPFRALHTSHKAEPCTDLAHARLDGPCSSVLFLNRVSMLTRACCGG